MKIRQAVINPNVVGKNMENAYRPDSIILEEEVPLALHKTEFEEMEKHA